MAYNPNEDLRKLAVEGQLKYATFPLAGTAGYTCEASRCIGKNRPARFLAMLFKLYNRDPKVYRSWKCCRECDAMARSYEKE